MVSLNSRLKSKKEEEEGRPCSWFMPKAYLRSTSGLYRSYTKRESKSNLSGNEDHYTACSLPVLSHSAAGLSAREGARDVLKVEVKKSELVSGAHVQNCSSVSLRGLGPARPG